jgi:hypothetical protein
MTAVTQRRPTRHNQASMGPWPALILIADLLALAYTVVTRPYATWGAFLVVLVLIALTLPMLRRSTRRDGHPEMLPLLNLAFAAKLAGTIARYMITFSVDYHLDDASNYDVSGAQLANSYRHLHFMLDHGVGSRATQNLRTITGAVYALTGHTELGAYFVFSWLGFLGLFLCYRAFCTALPGFDRRRYAWLLFFLPSLLFWPSAIGKDAWTLLSIGIVAYGTARILARRPGGLTAVIIGMAACTIVRPHVSAILFCGIIVAVFLRRGGGLAGSAKKWIAVFVLIVIGSIVIGRAKHFFGVETLNSASVTQVLDNAQTRSSVGHSTFTAAPVHNPLDLPKATASVLYRPFPWEAHNAVNIIASLEGVYLIGLTVFSWKRLVRLPYWFFRAPYVAFAVVYSLLFIVAFSHIGNFGILARQRTQLFPFALVLFAVPPTTALAPAPARHRTNARSRRSRV